MTGWDGEVVTTTERLTLRTFREDDLPLYAALNDEHGDRIHAITRERWIERNQGNTL